MSKRKISNPLINLLLLIVLLIPGCISSGNEVKRSENMVGDEKIETAQPNDQQVIEPAATSTEESEKMIKKNVLIEIRVPKELTTAEAFEMVSTSLVIDGFEIDEQYTPVPVTPSDDMALEIAAADEEVLLIRGTIYEKDEEDLKQNPYVINVWTDARIEPFDE